MSVVSWFDYPVRMEIIIFGVDASARHARPRNVKNIIRSRQGNISG
jgi:hypothetical protein